MYNIGPRCFILDLVPMLLNCFSSSHTKFYLSVKAFKSSQMFANNTGSYPQTSTWSDRYYSLFCLLILIKKYLKTLNIVTIKTFLIIVADQEAK